MLVYLWHCHIFGILSLKRQVHRSFFLRETGRPVSAPLKEHFLAIPVSKRSSLSFRSVPVSSWRRLSTASLDQGVIGRASALGNPMRILFWSSSPRLTLPEVLGALFSTFNHEAPVITLPTEVWLRSSLRRDNFVLPRGNKATDINIIGNQIAASTNAGME